MTRSVLVLVLLCSACSAGGDDIPSPAGVQLEGFPYPIGTAGVEDLSGGEWAVEGDAVNLSGQIAAAVKLSAALTRPNRVAECGLRPGGVAECWGSYGASHGTEGVYAAIDGTVFTGCGLRLSGEAHCWGDERVDAPDGRFEAISGWLLTYCGLRPGGSVECWGGGWELAEGVEPPVSDVEYPGGEFASVSAGEAHVCGLRPDGEAACWGVNWFGQADAPPGRFASVDSGASHSCGLRLDGVAVCWGQDSLDAATMGSWRFAFGGDEEAYAMHLADLDEPWVEVSSAALLDLEGVVPEGAVRAEMARRAEGWEPPAGPFVQVSVGSGFTCGLRVDREVECWGYFAQEEPRIPLEVYAEVYGPRLWDFYRAWDSYGATEREIVVRGRGAFDERFHSLYESLYGTRVWDLDPSLLESSGQFILAPNPAILKRLVAPLQLMDPPPGPFIAVKAGNLRACGLRPSGDLECWGTEDEGFDPPPGPFATEPITVGVVGDE